MRGDGGESNSKSGPDSAPVSGSESDPDDEASEADDGSEAAPCDESKSDGKAAGIWGGIGSVHTAQGREVVGLETLGGGAGTAAGGTTGSTGSEPATKDYSGRDPMWAVVCVSRNGKQDSSNRAWRVTNTRLETGSRQRNPLYCE